MNAYAPKTQFKLFMRDIAGITDFTTFMSKVEAIWGLDGFLSEMHETGIFNTVVSDTAPSDLTAIWIDPNNPATDAVSTVKMHNGITWVLATWELFVANILSSSPAGASPGTVVPSEESVISSDGETMINPSAGAITVGSDPTQAGLTGQGFVTIADYITAAITVVAASSIQTINGIGPDASGNVDLSVHSQDFDANGNVEFPVREPSDTEAKFEIYGYSDSADGNKRKIGMFEVPPSGVPEIDICPQDGTPAPADPIDSTKDYSGDFYWATSGDEPVLMMKRADGTFDAVGDFTENYALAMNGLILNGLGVLPCNVNFRNQGMTVDSSIKIGGSGYGWYKDTGVGGTFSETFGDKFIPYNASTPKKLSFFMKWDELTSTALPPENLLVYLAPFDRDRLSMSREMYYPSAFGKNPDEYFQNGTFTPQTYASAGPNVFLAQTLNPGDTEVFVNDVSFWDTNKATPSYRFMRFLNYSSKDGQSYLDYSRNVPEYYWSNYTSDTTQWGNFAESAIDVGQNKFTLNIPWAGEPIPAGTRVASCHVGETFNYLVAESKTVHTAEASEGQWRNISTVAPSAVNAEPFPAEVSFVKFGVFANSWSGPGRPNTSSQYRFSFASFFLGEGETYQSPNGTLWEIEVDDSGNVNATPF